MDCFERRVCLFWNKYRKNKVIYDALAYYFFSLYVVDTVMETASVYGLFSVFSVAVFFSSVCNFCA